MSVQKIGGNKMALDNTGDTVRNIEKTMDLAKKFIMTPAIYVAIMIFQFIARQREAHKMTITDWNNFDKFAKFCDYKFEVSNIPLTEEEKQMIKIPKLNKDGSPVLDENGNPVMENNKDAIKASIKERLDALGVHYCIMDEDFSEDNIKVYYSREDTNRFNQFLGDYIKERLVAGEMDQKDLNNLMNGNVSIISVPDEMQESLTNAMSELDVSYANIVDLNLTDGQKQMYIPTHQHQRVAEIYGMLVKDMVAKGADASALEMKTISQEELVETAHLKSGNEFINSCDKEYVETNDKFLNDSSKKFIPEEKKLKPLGSKDASEYIRNDSFEEISIDEETLISNSALVPELSQGETSEPMFCCRVPGTYGNSENVMIVPKDNVFLDKNSERTRYVAFLKKDSKVMIASKENGRLRINKKDVSEVIGNRTNGAKGSFDLQKNDYKFSQGLAEGLKLTK